mmetsp:Transcript_22580/g.73405  ORF Transcript_22580/g.73405 Transcript_22580/m.73405 type:complete len:91 (-) Transcript_22580:341-613(-)
MPARGELLQLYRHILKAAARYPSVKRATIISDIKAEFREGATVTDSAEIARRHELAFRSLDQLMAYARLDEDETDDWAVSLKGGGEQNLR